jgi:RNA polymerase sigma-70 factor, ECF subfamily
LSEQKFKALMVAGLAGNAEAYRALLELSASRLRAYFRYRLAGRDADVEDLVQETLLAIHNKRASYMPSLPYTAWLHAIARYRLIDFLRRQGRREVVPFDDLPELGIDDDSDAVLAEIDIERLLAELPHKQAAAIRLTRIDGLSIREASERTGQSEPSVKVNVHRGLARLIAKVSGGHDEDR